MPCPRAMRKIWNNIIAEASTQSQLELYVPIFERYFLFNTYLGEQCVFLIMDSATRFSIGFVVNNTAMLEATMKFEAQCIPLFWHPRVMLYDPTFDNENFTNYIEICVIYGRPIPPRCHNEDLHEYKHRIIRDIFLGLSNDFLLSTKS